MKQQGFAVLVEMAKLLKAHSSGISEAERKRLLDALVVLEPGNA